MGVVHGGAHGPTGQGPWRGCPWAPPWGPREAQGSPCRAMCFKDPMQSHVLQGGRAQGHAPLGPRASRTWGPGGRIPLSWCPVLVPQKLFRVLWRRGCNSCVSKHDTLHEEDIISTFRCAGWNYRPVRRLTSKLAALHTMHLVNLLGSCRFEFVESWHAHCHTKKLDEVCIDRRPM